MDRKAKKCPKRARHVAQQMRSTLTQFGQTAIKSTLGAKPSIAICYSAFIKGNGNTSSHHMANGGGDGIWEGVGIKYNNVSTTKGTAARADLLYSLRAFRF